MFTKDRVKVFPTRISIRLFFSNLNVVSSGHFFVSNSGWRSLLQPLHKPAFFVRRLWEGKSRHHIRIGQLRESCSGGLNVGS
jgi:hypothetical protein